jgi:hypothetical protein
MEPVELCNSNLSKEQKECKRILKFHNEDYKEHKPMHCIIHKKDRVNSKSLDSSREISIDVSGCMIIHTNESFKY